MPPSQGTLSSEATDIIIDSSLDLPGSGDTHGYHLLVPQGLRLYQLWWQYLRVWKCLCTIRSECDQSRTSLFFWISREKRQLASGHMAVIDADSQIFGINPFGYHLVNLSSILWTPYSFSYITPDDQVALAKCLCSLSVCDTSSPCRVCCVDSRAQGCSFHFFLDAHHGAYSYYVESPGFRRYCFVFLFFCFSLMAKPMLVTLPFVLLLLDYWPLRRFQEIKPDQKIQTEVLKSITSGKQKMKSNKSRP